MLALPLLLLLVVFQLLSRVWLSGTSWAAACQASLSFTLSPTLLKFRSIESVTWGYSFIQRSIEEKHILRAEDVSSLDMCSFQCLKTCICLLKVNPVLWVFLMALVVMAGPENQWESDSYQSYRERKELGKLGSLVRIYGCSITVPKKFKADTV